MPFPRFPRSLIRKLETPDLPLQTLEAIRGLRGYLDEVEAIAILRARKLGASPADIGTAIGLSRQAIYNRFHALEEHPPRDLRLVLPDLEVSSRER